MRWLDPSPIFALVLVACASGCSNSDNTTQPGQLEDASQPPPTKFEAGANCSPAGDDCVAGLVCLYPASTCNALPVCVAPPPSFASPPSACDHPQAACSCLGEPIEVCDGYASNPIDPTGTCEAGTIPPSPEGGSDASPAPEAGTDAGQGADASGPDASDASGD